MKLATIIIALTVLLTPTFSFPASSVSLVDQVNRSIVRVEYGDLLTNHNICTGFVVDSAKGQALTAAHCIPPNDEDLFVNQGVSTVLKRNEALAIIAVPKMTQPPLAIRARKVDVSESVWTFGFAWGKLAIFNRHIAGLDQEDIVTDGPLAPGMSGGPIVDKQGEVVGLNQASNAVIGIACGGEELLKFLR